MKKIKICKHGMAQRTVFASLQRTVFVILRNQFQRTTYISCNQGVFMAFSMLPFLSCLTQWFPTAGPGPLKFFASRLKIYFRHHCNVFIIKTHFILHRFLVSKTGVNFSKKIQNKILFKKRIFLSNKSVFPEIKSKKTL